MPISYSAMTSPETNLESFLNYIFIQGTVFSHLSPSVKASTPYLDTQYGIKCAELNLPATLAVLTTRPRAILTSGRNVIVTSIRPYRLTAATAL